jgi:hypothetical protein
MFPTAPALLVGINIIAAIAIATIGVSFLMYLFAATLVVTTGVAIHRSIPRKER